MKFFTILIQNYHTYPIIKSVNYESLIFADFIIATFLYMNNHRFEKGIKNDTHKYCDYDEHSDSIEYQT